MDFQTLVGIGVSVLLFLIGYRQTIGARKERAHAANVDLEKTLLKRVVLEAYKPSLEDVSRLIEGKARDHRVKISDIHSESQVLNTVFTRIMETDFITPEQRTEVLGRLSPIVQKAEESPVNEARVIEITAEKSRPMTKFIPALIGLFSAIMGSLVALASLATTATKIPVMEVFIAFGASLVLIGALFLLLRIREGQEDSGSENSLRLATHLEEQVAHILRRAGARVHIAGPTVGADFIAELRGKKLLIEVKALKYPFPVGLLRNVIERLRQALESQKADEALIVTRSGVTLPPPNFQDNRVRIVSIRELRNYLSQARRQEDPN